MIRRTLPLFVGQSAYVASTYLVQLVLARALGPESFGQWALVLSVSAMVSTLLTTGFGQVFARLVAENPTKAGSVISSSLRFQVVAGLAASVLYVAVAPLLAISLFRDREMLPYLLVSITIIVAQAAYNTTDSYLNGLRRFVQQGMALVFTSLSRLGLVLVLLLSGLGVFGAILGYAVGSAVGALSEWHFLRDIRKARASVPWRRYLDSGWAPTAFSVTVLLFMTIDLVAVKALLNDSQAPGYYAAAQTISRVVQFMFLIVGLVLLPSVSRALGQGDRASAQEHVSSGMRLLLLALTPLVMLMSAGAGVLVTSLFSPDYSEGAAALRWLAFGYGLLALFQSFASVLIGGGRSMTLLKFTLPIIAVDILLNILLVPRFSVVGAAVATTVSTGLAAAATLIYVARWLGISRGLGRSALRVLGLCGGLYALARLLPQSLAWTTVGYAGLGVLYIAGLVALKEVDLRALYRYARSGVTARVQLR